MEVPPPPIFLESAPSGMCPPSLPGNEVEKWHAQMQCTLLSFLTGVDSVMDRVCGMGKWGHIGKLIALEIDNLWVGHTPCS